MVVGRHPKRKSPGQFSPVETFYNGHRFDRRLEARWAVALDTLGVGFRYHTASANPGEGSMLELPGFRGFLVADPAWPPGTRGHSAS